MERTRVWLRRAALSLALGMAVVSCSKCGESGGVDASAVAEPPVPAPAGLLADVYVPSPNVAWGKLQRGIGGMAGILPATAGGVLCTALGLDPLIGNDIDGTAPGYAVLAGDPSNPSWALALKLADARKARGWLLDGEMARFQPKEEPGMTELVPKSGTNPPPAAIAITKSSYIVVARTATDLPRLAPYLTRTLPTRTLPSGGAIIADVPHDAITVTIKPKLDELWGMAKDTLVMTDQRMRAEHGGRAPDFGDPKPIIAALDGYATRRLAVVGDLEKMRIAIDIVDDGISVLATMTPAGSGGPAAKWADTMKIGDTAPVRSFPASSAIALAMRDGDDERATQGQELEKAMTSALGARLAEADAKKLHDTIEDWTKARGEATSIALAWDDPSGILFRTAARDNDAAARAMKGALDLARAMPFKEMLRVKDIAVTTEDLAGIGKASLATVQRDPPKDARDKEKDKRQLRALIDAGAPPAPPKPPKKDDLTLAWAIDKGALSIATGTEALVTLRTNVKPDKTIGDEPALVRPLEALGSGATFVLLAQPLRFDPKRANLPPAPLVIALGRKDKDGFFRMDVANGLLRELARWQLGL